METYRSKDIQEKLNVSKIQISHWTNMGCIKPFRADWRRGGSHEFNHRNLVEAAICKELSDLYIPVKSMAKALEMMGDYGFELCEKQRDLDWILIFLSPTASAGGSLAASLIPKAQLVKTLDYNMSLICLSLKEITIW